MRTRRASTRTLAGGVLPLVAMIAGCGGKETTASRSAAAYDEAQRKGVAVGGAAHGAQPSPETTATAMPGVDHSATGAKAHDPHAGMDHSGMAGMQARSQPRTDPHAGMDHSKMSGMKPSVGGMDQSKASHGMPNPPPSPEPESASARPGQPAATLHPDPVDQPAPTSVAEAARSAAIAAQMAGGGHAMSHGAYRHLDAGRDVLAPSPKPSPQAKGHKH